jgi:phosphoribosylamine--glycine ligase
MELSDDFALCEVMIGEAPQNVDGEIKTQKCLVTAGDYVLVANGTGKTVKEACDKAYKNVKMIEIPDCINVRDDVGERLEHDLPELQSYGWCTDWQYEEVEDGD